LNANRAVGGVFACTVHVRSADEGSVLPAKSEARTRNVCDPSASPVYVFGELQLVHEPASRLHSNVDGSEAMNSNVGDPEAVVPEGPEVIVVSGDVASTVHVRSAGVGSLLPARSVARTRNVCEPSTSPVYVVGELQGPNAPPSRLQSKVEDSDAEK